MSVIVWDGKTLAADRQTTTANLRRSTTKIWREGDVLIAGAGEAALVQAMKMWLLDGMKLDEFPPLVKEREDVTLWVINRNGTVRKFESTPFALSYHDETFAEGSGRDFAYGALSMGADARKAVEVACLHDVFCGGGVDVLSFVD